jgi:hypothetical protein
MHFFGRFIGKDLALRDVNLKTEGNDHGSTGAVIRGKLW